jgi:hypothetical protein
VDLTPHENPTSHPENEIQNQDKIKSKTYARNKEEGEMDRGRDGSEEKRGESKNICGGVMVKGRCGNGALENKGDTTRGNWRGLCIK